MATASEPRPTTQPGSGGKVVRARRPGFSRSPYERPTPRLSPCSGPPSPNWLSRLILSPTRMIATGTGKVLATVFDNHSSSSSLDVDSASEDDMDNVCDDNDIPPQVAGGEEKNQVSKRMNSLSKDSPSLEWKSKTKRVIEQLLMHETFTREECDRLIDIIKLRVVDFPITGAAEDQRQDVDVHDICSTAVIETKKWVEEKKAGSKSKSNLEYATCTFNTAMLPHVTEGEAGSPVDLAKSYMRAWPSQASPSLSHTQHSTSSSSPSGINLFKVGIPYSLGSNSASSSKVPPDEFPNFTENPGGNTKQSKIYSN